MENKQTGFTQAPTCGAGFIIINKPVGFTSHDVIAVLRGITGLSQEKLARLADVSNNTIINIEAGKQNNPTIETLKKIAKALDVGVDYLI